MKITMKHLFVLVLWGLCFFSICSAQKMAKDSHESDEKLEYYERLARVWGFLKYYHPRVALKEYNWDRSLLAAVEKLDACNDAVCFQHVLDELVDKAGSFDPCKDCFSDKQSRQWTGGLDWKWLLEDKLLSSSLRQKLINIRDEHPPIENKYINENFRRGKGKTENFLLDESYKELPTNSRSVGLLAFFQYWNVIEYFYPFKKNGKENWSQVLREYLPQFLQSTSELSYHTLIWELSHEIRDTHAGNSFSKLVVEKISGYRMLPFRMKMMPDSSIIISKIYSDSLTKDHKLRPGTQILTIDGISALDAMKKYMRNVAATNSAVRTREALHFVSLDTLRSCNLKILNQEGREKNIIVPRLSYKDIRKTVITTPSKWAFYGVNKDILYLRFGYINYKDNKKIAKLARNSNSIIFDLREGTQQHVASLLRKLLSSDFEYGKSTQVDPANPSNEIVFERHFEAHKKGGVFDGDLIALVDNNTLSRSEHCALMIQAAPNGKIIGETTSQAISNIAFISLPGNFIAYFTTINFISKDGISPQEEGIKIDIPVSYSIEGIRGGKDEILTKAIEYLEANKE